jgi:hypothetical protein
MGEFLNLFIQVGLFSRPPSSAPSTTWQTRAWDEILNVLYLLVSFPCLPPTLHLNWGEDLDYLTVKCRLFRLGSVS